MRAYTACAAHSRIQENVHVYHAKIAEFITATLTLTSVQDQVLSVIMKIVVGTLHQLPVSAICVI